jgi:hypothetical protein
MRARFASVLLAFFALAVTLNAFQSQVGVSAQPGGGHVFGHVYSFDQYDQLVPIAWADIVATNDQYTFTAYSGADGFYEILLPSGTYTLTVSEPGYVEYSLSVAVSNGSSSPLNFYLERSQVPIPEFSAYLLAVAILGGFGSVLAVTRRLKKRRR